MKKILCCTDGSPYATSVYDHTAWAAQRSGAAVHVLHMLDPEREKAQIADFSGNIGMHTSEQLLDDLVRFEETKNRLARERGKVILEAAREHLIRAGVPDVAVEQLHGGLVDSVTRREEDADLVVMGKRGEHADFASMHLGSNLERVIRASIRPVLVTSRTFSPIGSFLIAYDGGASIAKGIGFALTNPLLRGLKCHIIRAGRIDADAEWYLQETASRLRAGGYEVEAKAVAGDPEQVISDELAAAGVGLLMMGAYGHSRIRQLMVGSTTTAVVRTCRVPVLMFR